MSKTAAAARDLALDAAFDILNSGFLKFYSGTKPATADTGLSGNTLLATCTLGNPACAAASGGSKACNAIGDDTNAAATGVATWASFTKSDGTRIHDVTVGTSGAELTIDDVNIEQGGVISVTGYTFSMGA